MYNSWRAKAIYSLIAGVIVFSVGFGIYQYREKRVYQNTTESTYRYVFNSVIQSVARIDSDLTKLSAVRPGTENTAIFADIYVSAEIAHEQLSQLPDAQHGTDTLLKYLSDLRDYSLDMLNRDVNDESYQKRFDQINAYKSDAKTINEALAALTVALESGRLQLVNSEYTDESGYPANSLLTSLTPLNLTGTKAKTEIPAAHNIFENESPISPAEAESRLRNFLGVDTLYDLHIIGADKDTEMPVYSFLITTRGNTVPIYYADVTQNGGYITWFMNTSDLAMGERNISASTAEHLAARLLERNGFPHSEARTYSIGDDSYIFEMIPYYDGIWMYPEAITVKVGKDGQILGYSGQNFLENRRSRELKPPEISPATCLELVSPHFTLTECALAVIDENGIENFCYELIGYIGDTKTLIYVDTQNGHVISVYEQIEDAYGIQRK